MFGDQPFYHGSIRRYTAAFGALFSKVQLHREDNDGTVLQTVDVPLTYGPKDKYTTIEEGRTDDGIRRQLPRMSFWFNDLELDRDRKTNNKHKLKHSHVNKDHSRNYSYGRVPYNFTYSLLVVTKTMDDMLRIVEPILAYFDPILTINIEDLDPEDLDINQNIPIRLVGVDKEDDWAEAIDETRTLQWTLNFELQGWMYKRVESAPTITKVKITDWDDKLNKATQVLRESTMLSNDDRAIQFAEDLYELVHRGLPQTLNNWATLERTPLYNLDFSKPDNSGWIGAI